MDYRKIWEKKNGPIPVDENGRKYEIHHIDGDRKNNSINNLMCLSVKEHYTLHLKQKDYQAAGVIASRMKVSTEELELIKKGISEKTLGKPKPWLNKPREKIKCQYCGRLNGGGGHERSCRANPNRDPILRPNLSKTIKGIPKKKTECNFCNKEISLGNLHRHETSCKLNKERRDFTWKVVKCPYCSQEGGLNIMKRWHFENCKSKI